MHCSLRIFVIFIKDRYVGGLIKIGGYFALWSIASSDFDLLTQFEKSSDLGELFVFKPIDYEDLLKTLVAWNFV